MIYIFLPFLTDCDQNYMQMLNHMLQINDKKLRRPLFIVHCSRFLFFQVSQASSTIFRLFPYETVRRFSFPGFCRLSLKTLWRKVKKQAVSKGPHHWMVSCGQRKADSFKNIWQYKNISEFVQICTLRPSLPYRKINFQSQKCKDSTATQILGVKSMCIN